MKARNPNPPPSVNGHNAERRKLEQRLLSLFSSVVPTLQAGVSPCAASNVVILQRDSKLIAVLDTACWRFLRHKKQCAVILQNDICGPSLAVGCFCRVSVGYHYWASVS